jgi:hypothetical protein
MKRVKDYYRLQLKCKTYDCTYLHWGYLHWGYTMNTASLHVCNSFLLVESVTQSSSPFGLDIPRCLLLNGPAA